jgi:hypothetical protein
MLELSTGLENSHDNSSHQTRENYNRNKQMKIHLLKSKCLAAVLAALGSQLIGTPASSAAELYPVALNAFSISTNQDGNLTYHEFNNWTLLRESAQAQGLTNLTGLSLVYNQPADDIEVVSGTNNTVLDTPLTFAGGVSLNNTNDTKVQRLANVYWESNQTAAGTLVASECIGHGATNQITSFKLTGQLQFALPASGTNAPVIYVGHLRTFSLEPRFSFEDGD